jgi:hypothetical protein
MKAQKLIYEMLTENTGRHMLDSGGAYGRNWERNQKKTIEDFENEDEEVITFDGNYIERRVSVFHYLSQLQLDDICEEFNRLNTNPSDWEGDIYGKDSVYGVSRQAADYLNDNFEVEIERSWNTYNGESDLSQILQGSNLEIFGEQYILIQIHGGCDARGGYTDAKLFKLQDDYVIHEYLQEFKYQDEIIEDLEHWDEDEIIKHPYKDKEYKVKEVLTILNQEA